MWQSDLEAEIGAASDAARRLAGRCRGLRAAHDGGDELGVPGCEASGCRVEGGVARVTNHPRDRYVLAAAVAAYVGHVVTVNLHDFPVTSRPSGVAVQASDRFLLDRPEDDPERMGTAVVSMAARHIRPLRTPEDLAALTAGGRFVPRFGAALLEAL